MMAFPCYIERFKIKRYMKSIGFERYVIKTKTFDNIPVWGYRRINTNEIITEDELLKMSLQQVKYEFREGEKEI